jgi:hypothetical protein
MIMIKNKNMTTTKGFIHPAPYAVIASITVMSMLFLVFFAAEPSISHGQEATEDFYIRQTITAESSFMVPPVNTTMTGGIAGVTGGTGTGTSQFVVQTNNAAGYYVEIDFFDNGSGEAMLGDESGSAAIRDYDGATMQPSYGYTASTGAAMLSYTVTSSSSADTDASFFNNGAACGVGGSQAVPCWMAPSTTAFRIVDTSAAAVDGATSTIQFYIDVPAGATPVPQAEVYTATATLSLFLK